MNTDTKTQLLNLAEQFILTKGFSGFSYKDLSDIIGIRKASIHHHFPSKELLVKSVLERYHHRFVRWEEMQSEKKPSEKLHAFVEMYRALSDHCNRICPLGMLLTEFENIPESLHHTMKSLVKSMENWLETVLTEGQGSNEFSKEFQPHIKATVIISLLSGTLKFVRLKQDLRFFDAVETEIFQMVRG